VPTFKGRAGKEGWEGKGKRRGKGLRREEEGGVRGGEGSEGEGPAP